MWWCWSALVCWLAVSIPVAFIFGRMCALYRDRRYRETEVVGGHCGICGAWCPDEVVPESWPWTVCDKCVREYGEVSGREVRGW